MDKSNNILNSDPCTQFIRPELLVPVGFIETNTPDRLKLAIFKLLHTEKLFRFYDYIVRRIFLITMNPKFRLKWKDGYTEFLTIPQIIDYFIPDKKVLLQECLSFDKHFDTQRFEEIWNNRYTLYENYGDEESFKTWFSKRYEYKNERL